MTIERALMGTTDGGAAEYVEDVFSTYLYTGNGSTQTITNGIDLAGKGGMVWLKGRSGATDHALYDTARGATKDIVSNSTAAETTQSTGLTAFGSTGFSIGALAKLNTSAATYASWTFRKAPKFFDVVTYTGTGSLQNIAHNLGSVPKCIIVKRTDSTGDWFVYHGSLGTPETNYLKLNTTDSTLTNSLIWGASTPTSSVFSVGGGTTASVSGAAYVAYLFAHDAGGFGAAGTDSVVSCGSYTGNGSATGPTVTLGWEPQFLMIKKSSGTGNWQILDNMRGIPVGSADATLQANLTNAELSVDYISPTATGFQVTSTNTEVNTSGATYIYLAIRRPMKTPTSGASVFAPVAQNAALNANVVSGFDADSLITISRNRTGTSATLAFDRIRGSTMKLEQNTTAAQSNNGASYPFAFDNSGKIVDKYWNNAQVVTSGIIYWLFKRAPGFFDVVCYAGTGVARTVNHNLGVNPELIVAKCRSGMNGWFVGSSRLTSWADSLQLDTTGIPFTENTLWNATSPTSSVFSLGTDINVNQSGATFVAYLFASCPGVSKVGSYTGNGSTQTINCGFTAGARFVLIKPTSFTADWFVWDTARGIVSGNDPHLSLNTTAAEVTTDNSINPDPSGFIVNYGTSTNINVGTETYIYLAIA